MLLALSDDSGGRFYSLSKRIHEERKEYYDMLKRAQCGGRDITEWLVWFLDALRNAMRETEDLMKNVLMKATFWDAQKDARINERQRSMINILFDGLSETVTTKKWSKITKCSVDTALRDIGDLIEKGILGKGEAGGRSAYYELIPQYQKNVSRRP
jgi:Fic family protein